MIVDPTNQELVEAQRGCGFEKTFNPTKDYNIIGITLTGVDFVEDFTLNEVTVLSEIGIITGLCIKRDSMGRVKSIRFGPTVFESKNGSIFRVVPKSSYSK